MSIKALNWAFSVNMKSGPKFVLVALANYADEEMSCYPSYDQLSEMTGIAPRTIGAHLTKMEEEGIISRTRKRYKDGNYGGYRFTLHTQILPVADLRKTTRRFAQNHTQIWRDNNHHNNHHKNQKPKNEVFEQVWKDIAPKLPKSRRSGKRKTEIKFTQLAKEYGEIELTKAIRSFYNDQTVSKENYKYAPALLVCLNGGKFEGYLGDTGQNFKPVMIADLMDQEDQDDLGTAA